MSATPFDKCPPSDWGADLGRWFLGATPSRLTPGEAREWDRLAGWMWGEVERRGARVLVADGDRHAAPPHCPQCEAPWEPDCGCRPREGRGATSSHRRFAAEWAATRTVWLPERAVARGPVPGTDVRSAVAWGAWHDAVFHGEEGLNFSYVHELVAHVRAVALLRHRVSPGLWEVFVNLNVAATFAGLAAADVPANKVVRGRAPSAPWLY